MGEGGQEGERLFDRTRRCSLPHPVLPMTWRILSLSLDERVGAWIATRGFDRKRLPLGPRFYLSRLEKRAHATGALGLLIQWIISSSSSYFCCCSVWLPWLAERKALRTCEGPKTKLSESPSVDKVRNNRMNKKTGGLISWPLFFSSSTLSIKNCHHLVFWPCQIKTNH